MTSKEESALLTLNRLGAARLARVQSSFDASGDDVQQVTQATLVGMRATADLDMSGFRIVNVGAAQADEDVANRAYVDSYNSFIDQLAAPYTSEIQSYVPVHQDIQDLLTLVQDRVGVYAGYQEYVGHLERHHEDTRKDNHVLVEELQTMKQGFEQEDKNVVDAVKADEGFESKAEELLDGFRSLQEEINTGLTAVRGLSQPRTLESFVREVLTSNSSQRPRFVPPDDSILTLDKVIEEIQPIVRLWDMTTRVLTEGQLEPQPLALRQHLAVLQGVDSMSRFKGPAQVYEDFLDLAKHSNYSGTVVMLREEMVRFDTACIHALMRYNSVALALALHIPEVDPQDLVIPVDTTVLQYVVGEDGFARPLERDGLPSALLYGTAPHVATSLEALRTVLQW